MIGDLYIVISNLTKFVTAFSLVEVGKDVDNARTSKDEGSFVNRTGSLSNLYKVC